MFHGCSIDNLTIPCNVKYLQPNWYDGVNIDSFNVSISPENHNLLFLNEKIIIGKTDQNNDNYDVILFACRDIEEENIPDYVKKIGPYAFSKCKQLRTIHFSENSQLSEICEGAFDQSSLKNITIPSHIQIIPNNAFSNCENLTINFAPNSDLCSFGELAFLNSSIQSLFIPKYINNIIHIYKNLKYVSSILISPENHNFLCLNEKLLLGKTNPNSNDFDVIIFASNNCVNENIPDNIKIIGSYAFSKCNRLIKINFSENSQLSKIDSYAFFESSLREIKIPKYVTELGERSFSRCFRLGSFQFAPNSNLRTICSSAFLSSSIPSISIPSSVTHILDNAFSDCSLRTIIFPEDSQLQSVGRHLFYSTTIQNATIPQHLAGIIHINQ